MAVSASAKHSTSGAGWIAKAVLSVTVCARVSKPWYVHVSLMPPVQVICLFCALKSPLQYAPAAILLFTKHARVTPVAAEFVTR